MYFTKKYCGRTVLKTKIKLASKLLKSRSESFTESTESDGSYESSGTDNTSETESGSESETDVEASESVSIETNATSQSTSLSKATITYVTVPRKILIKYSANIENAEQPKINSSIRLKSESSDPGILESDYSNEDEDETHPMMKDQETESLPSKEDVTTSDASEFITETNPACSKNALNDETEVEEDDESKSSEESDDEEGSTHNDKNINDYKNGSQSSTCYNLEDFQLLKTIGKFRFR